MPISRRVPGVPKPERQPGLAAQERLLAHTDPEAVVAYRGGRPTTARDFLAEATQLAARLPAGKHVLNACADRYRFAVGFAASLVSERVSLLPSTHTPEVIRHLRAFAPDVICLTDDPACAIELPQLLYPEPKLPASRSAAIPAPPTSQLAAYVFTSGTTGTPVPHAKTWGRVARCVKVEATRVGLDGHRGHTVVATVPPQHMYGFESTVLLPMLSGTAFTAERPFYPADVCSDLARVPRPRLLVSTPVHLRALLAAQLALPEVDLVMSATAPLELELARSVESRLGCPLLEIYGSTETGQIASRRPTQTREWQLWPGVALSERQGRTWAEGGHIETPTPMGDVLEVTEGDRFLMHGRTEDLINIAGKRSSLAYLNHQLNAIPGVVDGAFFLRETNAATGIARLAALVVAPGLDAGTITGLLRARLDPVFLPRPLLIVDDIPRSATGKLPLHVLKSLTAGD
jgi:acyl-coenzyme A synthetase/AMP-(fatty) acid ligase